MKEVDISLFPDIADALGLQSPAFIEKDYYAIILLKLICEIDFFPWKVSFSGGTCLGKAHLSTYRMSEDIDLKFIFHNPDEAISQNRFKLLRKLLKTKIIETIEQSELFNLNDAQSRDSGSFRSFSITYPRSHNHGALRPELKLEFTETRTHPLNLVQANICSIYSEVLKLPKEIASIDCDPIETILIEKTISLLRRTAEVERKYNHIDDNMLIRHLYDIYLINEHGYDVHSSIRLFPIILKQDQTQFGARHIEFKNKPGDELSYALELLRSNPKYQQRYQEFLNPLVYNPSPPTWKNAIECLDKTFETLRPF